ncbi:MAG: polynucleotide adenylyltransferase PcnB [Gammaproteobacteria bacterium]|jgi:poly(A) polymerase
MNDTNINQLNYIRSRNSLETDNANSPQSPIVLQRDGHIISRSNISEPALKVLYRLKKSDYDAFLVGGGVRDLLLDRPPKDFDIVTDARPEDVSELFRNSRLIGRRFQLVHVHYGKEIIEVATYRGHEEADDDESRKARHMRDGMLIRDNVFGTIEEDAWRRDFTINALYYNIQDFSVIDYTGGLQDLQQKLIRMIGDPDQRYREDPVRMLRAVRFAAKLGFSIAPETEAPIYELADRLTHVPPARLFEEVLKLFLGGYAVATYELLRKYQLFDRLFPLTAGALHPDNPGSDDVDAFIRQGLANTDERIAQGKPVTPAFLFSVMLWWPMKKRVEHDIAGGARPLQAYQHAGSEIVARQTASVSLPKRFSIQTREIWSLQPRLPNRSGKRGYRLLALPRFRAGYDFMLLRAQTCEPELQPLCDWWTEFQDADDQTRSAMLKKVQPPRRRGGRRSRKKRRAE